MLVVLAFGGAFLAGLVGVGGAIIMIPLLLFVPPLLGLQELGIGTVAGITTVQVVAAALSGLVGHRDQIHRGLFFVLGPPMAVSSLLGGLASGVVPSIVMEAVFASMATLAALLLLVLGNRSPPDLEGELLFSRRFAVAAGGAVGFSAGMIGAGGAFFLVPVMLYGLRVPVRIAVASSLSVVALSASGALVGKAIANQVDWYLAIPLVVGSVPGARIGAMVSKRVSSARLVAVLGIAILAVACRMWIGVLAHSG